ncbi:SIMPL domain-containing protein [Idiomarina xiamenensis]|uniref:Periplasmic protein n=1 Tax=Idiomarina xiamenensis 10-D-4 TaxID=740709 RepID=K2K883_9GAMM|nr:SIMPL domain-containing protein [Idiomarina xiamenensis]EKE82792.1 hypothetical protein A10D4_09309 [Idiomarina xiamenensis 10-D-4]
MSKSNLLLAVAVVIASLILGYSAVRSVDTLQSYSRTVTVKGLAEREVKADTAIWPVQFVRAGNNLNEVYQQLESDAAAINAFLLERGFSADEVSLTAPQVTDKVAQAYSSNDVGLRYSAQQTITVYTNQVDAVREALQHVAELGKKGIAISGDMYSSRIEYLFTGLNDIKPTMIEEATRNAREVATKFAADSGSQVGKIRRAQQGIFSIADRDSSTPYLKKVRVVSTVEYLLVD